MNGSWIDAANETGSRMMEALWRASWQGAVGILIVWILCRFWKGIPSGLRSALWLFVCLKLLVAMLPATIGVPCLPSPTPTVAANAPAPYVHPSIDSVSNFIVPPQPAYRLTPVTQPHPSLSIKAWLAMLWLIGVAFVAAIAIKQVASSIRLIRRASPCTDQEALDQAHVLGQTMGLRSEPRIFVSEASDAVLTFCGPRPIVLLSLKMLETCSAEELQMVLAHEFAHITRRDAWLGLIPQLAQTLFYFHPLVWIACREFDFSREAACDEAAISTLSVGSDLYARLLLKLVSRQATATSFCTPGVSSHFQLLRRRIAMLDKPIQSTPRRIHRRTLLLVCLAGALCIAPFSLVQGQFASQAVLKSHSLVSAKKAAKKSTKVAVNHAVTAAKHVPMIAAKQIASNSKASIRVFRLKNADAAKAAEILRQVLGTGGQSRVAADARTNTIVVFADDSTTAQIANVIKNLEQIDRVEPKSRPVQVDHPVVSVFPLKYAKAEEFEKTLLQLYGNPSFGTVKFAADARTNTMIITTPADRAEELRSLVNRMDVMPPVDQMKVRVTRLFPVRHADPRTMCTTIKAMLGMEDLDFFDVDTSGKSLVVRATEDKCNEIAVTLSLLDIQK